jgi:hypothetical protein
LAFTFVVSAAALSFLWNFISPPSPPQNVIANERADPSYEGLPYGIE